MAKYPVECYGAGVGSHEDGRSRSAGQRGGGVAHTGLARSEPGQGSIGRENISLIFGSKVATRLLPIPSYRKSISPNAAACPASCFLNKLGVLKASEATQ